MSEPCLHCVIMDTLESYESFSLVYVFKALKKVEDELRAVAPKEVVDLAKRLAEADAEQPHGKVQ